MKKIQIDFVPLAISIMLVFISILMVLTKGYVLNWTHYVGILSLMTTTLFYFFNKTIYYLLFGTTLTLGIFGLVDFYYTTYKVGFGDMSFNLIFIILLGVMLFILFQKASMEDREKNMP